MPTDHLPLFGDLLREHRLAAGLSQEELAERAGISVRAVSDLERGYRRAPHRDTVQLLANALDLAPANRAALEGVIVRHRGPSASWPASARAGTSGAGRSSTLPLPLTSLVGREQEVAAASHLLLRDNVRLLTLTGPAGVGKTRLAVRVAAELDASFSDGVVFVSLAPLVGADSVVPAIAGALGVRETDETPLHESVRAACAGKHLLLVLDNMEHVLAAAAWIMDVLAAAPRLTVLATSRAALRVRGEHGFPVSPLATPDARREAPPEALSHYASVRLFVERARTVRPDFALTPSSAPAVAAICARLDGLPLAIELAAPRIKLFSPQALLARLDGAQSHTPLRMLTGGPRDLPARQQTLRDAIAWSYDLLDGGEQAVFRRLAVFAGGCALEEAEAVAGPIVDGSMDILDVLTALVDKSLLRVHEQADGTTRFVMLETIREYGLECAAEHGETGAAADAHLACFLQLAEEAEPKLSGADQGSWLQRLEVEHDNLRAALRWALRAGSGGRAMRLAAALWRFWWMRGHLSEGRAWLEEALSAVTATGIDGSLDRAAYARALNGGGVLAYMQGDHGRAATLHEQSLALRRSLGDRRGIAASLSNLGNLALDQGDLDRAAALHEEGLAVRREVGDMASVAVSLNNLGEVARQRGDLDRAMALYEESLSLRRALGNEQGIATTLGGLGSVAIERGDLERARALIEESLALRRQLGDTQGVATTLTSLARIRRGQGAAGAALALYEQSFALYRQLGDRLGLAWCAEGVAGVAAASALWEQAARLFGAAAALRASIGVPLSRDDRAWYDRDVAAVRTALGESAFSELRAMGQVRPPDEVIANALRLIGSVDEEGDSLGSPASSRPGAMPQPGFPSPPT